MDLERIAIVLRPRQGWEAIDLGFRMTAHWAVPLWRVWFTVFAPSAALVLIACRDWPWLAAVLLWWAKPLFDRYLLFVLSHAVFGAVPGVLTTLRASGQILRTGAVAGQFTRFVNFARSFNLPVTQLEAQYGLAARRRRSVLGQRWLPHAVGLTLVCVLFEQVVFIGAGMLGELLTPGPQWEFASEPNASADIDSWWGLRENLLYLLAISVIEPFYVAGGFALYLNRRVLLEGWDIELALRRMAGRRSARDGKSMIGAGLLLLALGLLVSGGSAQALQSDGQRDAECSGESASKLDRSGKQPDKHEKTGKELVSGEKKAEQERSSEAESKAVPTPRDTAARRHIVAVFAHADFGGNVSVMRWMPIEEARTERGNDNWGWMKHIGEALAVLGRVIAWIAIGVLAVAVLLNLSRRWRASPDALARTTAPNTLFGLAIDPDSLPEDVVAAALAALAAGHAREALSLLYRGALSDLVHRRGLSVGRGATEGEVLVLAASLLSAEASGYFQRLLPTWTAAAYGGRPPAVAAVRHLCADYASHFHACAAATLRESAGDAA